MNDNIQNSIIESVFFFMLLDPQIDSKPNLHTQKIIIDYALHFEQLFRKNEINNMTEYFYRIHNKQIKRMDFWNKLNQEEQTFYRNRLQLISMRIVEPEKDQNLKFIEKKEVLKKTLEEVESNAKSLYDSMSTYQKFDPNALRKVHKTFLSNLQNIWHKLEQSELPKKLRRPQALTTFMSFLKQANMNYILNLGGMTIYPFLHDLLLSQFLADTRIQANNVSYTDQDFFFTIKDKTRDYKYHPIDDAEYMDLEYLKLFELFTYLQPDELEHFLLQHYADILHCDYNKILSVHKQIKYNVSDHHKYLYKKKDFSLSHIVSFHDFRYYSRYIKLNVRPGP